MSEDKAPPDLMISAQIRIAAREGIPITVVRRGDSNSGTIILKINNLNGTARVLTQVRYNDELVWTPATRTDPMTDTDANRYLDEQTRIDPDSWLIEIEDKQGRHWFPGKVIKL